MKQEEEDKRMAATIANQEAAMMAYKSPDKNISGRNSVYSQTSGLRTGRSFRATSLIRKSVAMVSQKSSHRKSFSNS